MYELSIAAKYLTPRWRQLSVSIISLISILVIAVVVWLIVVFFSVTNGLTDSWLDKLTALTAPVRVTPTKAYYDSYYYQIDGISAASDYASKTIGEKLLASRTDPYDPTQDTELPTGWKLPDTNDDGNLKDPVKLAFSAIAAIEGVKGLSAAEYESNAGKLHLRVFRKSTKNIPSVQKQDQPQGYISHASIFGSLDPQNPQLLKALVTPTMADLSNMLTNLDWEAEGFQNGESLAPNAAHRDAIKQRLQTFFDYVTIDELMTSESGWQLPVELLPKKARWEAIAMLRGDKVIKLIIPAATTVVSALIKQRKWQGYTLEKAVLEIDGTSYQLQIAGQPSQQLPTLPRLFVPGGVSIKVSRTENNFDNIRNVSDILFNGELTLQGTHLRGSIRYSNLEIGKATLKNRFEIQPPSEPFWLYAVGNGNGQTALQLPQHPSIGSGVLLPRAFRETGLKIGDSGSIIYPSASPTGLRDEQIPIFVAGFYDPGIIPIGGKYIISNSDVVAQMRAPINHDETLIGNGINVRFTDRNAAEDVKNSLKNAFENAGIADYWKIETFRDFEFTRDVIQQLQSDKHLFSLLATLIIVVACSNIISMLIILVNDKKSEIGILRSMGASSFSIALIFGSCGIFIGVVGSIAGTIAAIITLKNLQPIVSFISWVQGYNMFNPIFYGESLPTDLNLETLSFVIGATAAISLLAGIIPAIKASLLKPAAILRAE
jgi:lipoprotein-releasing system permease protein